MLILISPFIILLLIVSTFISVIFRHKKLFFILLAFSICFNYLIEFFAWHINYVDNKSHDNIIKVVCFNVKSAQNQFEGNASKIADILIEENADFVFLSELYNSRAKFLLPFLEKDYPYIGIQGEDYKEPSVVFLSKWPINKSFPIKVDSELIMKEFNLDYESLKTQKTKHSSIYKTQIDLLGNNVNFIGCHLIGNNYYTNTDSYSIDSINSLGYLKSYLKNVQESYRFRALQADAVCMAIDSITSPLIVMGDMNDIGGSYTIRSLENKGLEDAWWNGGWGYGTTFEQGWLKLRLDHILFSPKSLKLRSIKTIDTGMSDHKCLVAEFELK